MNSNDSAIALVPQPLLPSRGAALSWGLVGVLAFSFTVPFTKVAAGGLSPLFIGSGRAVVAVVLAAVALRVTRQRLPQGAQWVRLAVVAGGIVVGFPLLTSFALTSVPASHGAVVIALLPAVTAVTVVLRTHEQPPTVFWLAAGVGALAAVGFAVVQSGGWAELHLADLLLFGAVVAAAIGYAEGGLLARELGAWQTVSWALVVAAPVMLGLAVVSVVRDEPTATGTQWAAFAYLGVVSMFLRFVAWYRGLALGPMAQVSQIQLVQPVFTLCWAALLLHEQLTATTVLGGLVVIACAAGAVRIRLAAPATP